MTKRAISQPIIVLLYGFPGVGKTYFARQFCEHIQAAHIQADRIRFELFEHPRYDKQENSVITQLMRYMSEEFLSAGISVVYDDDLMRLGQRHSLRELARKCHAKSLLVWFQMDTESSYLRNLKRDRRRIDDKYAAAYDQTTFNNLIGQMQNPASTEDYIVVSGKHTFSTQFSTVARRLRELGLLGVDELSPVVKPGMVNLVPKPNMQQGRFDPSRRNIVIR
ncbi:MAG: AAA family ATPase [Candidatus Saccharimonadales bacterium]